MGTKTFPALPVVVDTSALQSHIDGSIVTAENAIESHIDTTAAPQATTAQLNAAVAALEAAITAATNPLATPAQVASAVSTATAAIATAQTAIIAAVNGIPAPDVSGSLTSYGVAKTSDVSSSQGSVISALSAAQAAIIAAMPSSTTGTATSSEVSTSTTTITSAISAAQAAIIAALPSVTPLAKTTDVTSAQTAINAEVDAKAAAVIAEVDTKAAAVIAAMPSTAGLALTSDVTSAKNALASGIAVMQTTVLSEVDTMTWRVGEIKLMGAVPSAAGMTFAQVGGDAQSLTSNTFIPTGFIGNSVAYTGVVEMPDGIHLINGSTSHYLINQAGNISLGAAKTAFTNIASSGGRLSASQQLIFMPSNTAAAQVYNCTTNTVSAVANAPGYGMSLVIPVSDGVVLVVGLSTLSPYNSFAYLYTYSSNTYVDLTASIGTAFYGNVPNLGNNIGGYGVLPSGNIIVLSAGTGNYVVFNVTTKTFGAVKSSGKSFTLAKATGYTAIPNSTGCTFVNGLNNAWYQYTESTDTWSNGITSSVSYAYGLAQLNDGNYLAFVYANNIYKLLNNFTQTAAMYFKRVS